ncbi:MAG: START-like domain-containing protein [Flammeovirgaceae bacterium]
MAKYKYITEFEITASVKMLYPYLSSAAGLQEWFADEVNVIGDKLLDIVWDGVSHPAKIISRRINHHIKYQFIKQASEEEEANELQYLEFRLDYNEMTQTSFLKIIDYSDMDNDEDLSELWEGLIDTLKEKIGAH